MWTQKQIKDHKIAAKKLLKIKDATFNFIKKQNKISEFDVQQFILDLYEKEGMRTDDYLPFVGFGKRTATPYQNYKANKKRINAKNNLIAIDIWASLNSKSSPFSDTRWIAYKGKTIPKSAVNEFSKIIKVRNNILSEIKKKLKKKQIPTAKEIYGFAKKHLAKGGYKGKTYVGHSLGINDAHGKHGELIESNNKPIAINVGYALEPGMYSKGYHWITNEINFYIAKNHKLVLTTKKQNKIIKL